jgi:uncharacterized short protein YbdD (DUF466 family)
MLGERKERKLRKERTILGRGFAASVPAARSALSAFSARSLVHSFLFWLRRIAGMPDYEAHIEHLRRCHPNYPIPTERQYFEQFLESRYHDGPTRCC